MEREYKRLSIAAGRVRRAHARYGRAEIYGSSPYGPKHAKLPTARVQCVYPSKNRGKHSLLLNLSFERREGARCFTSHAAPVRPSFVPKLTPSARSPRHAYQGMRRPSSQLMTVPVVDMSALRISYRTRLQPMCGSTAPSMSQMCAYFLVISVRLKPGWSS